MHDGQITDDGKDETAGAELQCDGPSRLGTAISPACGPLI